jgi:translation initiation factor 2 subunit 1
MKRNTFPELNEVVLFKVTLIDEIAIYGSLVEYNDIKAMMIYAEVSARRIKSIYQHIKEGQEVVAIVTQVDTERGHINLSRKQVTTEDKEVFMIGYSNRKKVNTILYKLSLQYNCDISNLYDKLWVLSDNYDCLYSAFKNINIDNTILDKVELDTDIKKCLLTCIEKLCVVPLQTFNGEMHLHCFHIDGVDVIKEAIKYGISIIGSNKISVHYLSAPLYELRTKSYEINNAEELFNTYANIVNNYLSDKQGSCSFNRIIKEDEKQIKESSDSESD